MNRVTSKVGDNIYWVSNYRLDEHSKPVSNKFIWVQCQCGKSRMDLISINIFTRESISGRCYFIAGPLEKKLFLCLSISKKLFSIKIGVVDHLRITPINTSQPPAVKDNFDFESTWPRFVAHFGAYCQKSEKKSLKR